MDKNMKELNLLGKRLEADFDQLEQMAMAEVGGEDAAELWLRARFRAAIAFDEHAALLRDVQEERNASNAASVEELRKVAAYDHSSPRLSTFTKVEMGEDVRALTAIHSALNKESADTTNTKGTGE